MAKNASKGAGRKGTVKGRAQVFNGRNNRFIKTDTKSGKFIDQYSKRYKSFKGVKRHS